MLMEQTAKRILSKLGYEISRIKPDADPSLQSALKSFEELAQDYRNRQCLKLHFGCGPRVLKRLGKHRSGI